jgi:EF hand
MKSTFLFLIAVFLLPDAISAQRPPRDGQPEWINTVDADKNGRIDADEYRSAADVFFKNHDKNGNDILEENELPQKPVGDRPPQPPRETPPFLFLERGERNLTRAEFDEKSAQRFISADKNDDGEVDREELQMLRPPRGEKHERFQTAPPPNTKFLEAEMRFGDKMIVNAPFSAETVIENSRRLFDGSVVTKQTKGAFYRDKSGRTRREQTLEDIGGYSLSEAQKLVFINDFEAKTHFFMDVNRKIFRRRPLGDNRPPKLENELQNGKNESLGTKMLEGVKVEGTRTTFEIPVGQIGNDKAIQVVTEKWFSPELQMTVMSRHVDPLAGEQVFRLVNIKLGEPSADLFIVPKDFRKE